MTRSELKQLIRETIEEISADTAARAAQKARNLDRDKPDRRGPEGQAGRLQISANRKNLEKITSAIGASPDIVIKIGNDYTFGKGSIVRLLAPNQVGVKYPDARDSDSALVQIKTAEGHLFDLYPSRRGILASTFQTRDRSYSVLVDRASRIKLIKAFKYLGVNVNANDINISDQ